MLSCIEAISLLWPLKCKIKYKFKFISSAALTTFQVTDGLVWLVATEFDSADKAVFIIA